MHKKAKFERCGDVANYTLDSILAIRAAKGEINQIVIPCSYPPDAHHPALWDLLVYAAYNFYKALEFKLFHKLT